MLSLRYTIPLLLVFLVRQSYTRDVDFCFVDEDDPYLYMGTKTAYHFVHAGKTRFQEVPNCRAVQVWMLATHGTRCPSASEITDMLTLTELKNQIIHNHETRGDGHMCNRDLENLKRWRPDAYLAMQRAEVLTPQGVEDMRLLARRLQSNFPDLLQPQTDHIVPTDYKFKTTDGQDSMAAFMEGLFGTRTAVTPEESSINDTTLATYKTCHSWNNEEEEEERIEELLKFDEGTEFKNLVQNVSRRLGYLYNISEQSIHTMYDMCRYEKAWTVIKLSPWCAIFSKEELRVLEYREDLEYYYKAGYGREMNAQLGCPLLQDMMNHFWKVEQDVDSIEPKGIFYFSDIMSLQNLLTSLRINQDDKPLTAADYKEMAKRQWRTSFISPFAANLVAVFYKCDNSRQPNKVMFYLAEKLVMFEGCDVGLCDWEYLKKKLGRIATRCNLDVCLNGYAAASSYLPNLSLLLVVSFLLVVFRQ